MIAYVTDHATTTWVYEYMSTTSRQGEEQSMTAILSANEKTESKYRQSEIDNTRTSSSSVSGPYTHPLFRRSRTFLHKPALYAHAQVKISR
jgi:hypothetical protein